MTEDVKYIGLPTMSLFPLRNAEFKIVGDLSFTIPKEGNFKQLSPEVFKDDDNDFVLFRDGVLYTSLITKVLLASNKYPNLNSNQVFTPYAIIIEDDNVVISGNVIEIYRVMT